MRLSMCQILSLIIFGNMYVYVVYISTYMSITLYVIKVKCKITFFNMLHKELRQFYFKNT